MRWSELFDDLEARADSLVRAERETEVADRTRAEIGRLVLLNRLRSGVGRELSLRVLGCGAVIGTLERVGTDWLLLTCPQEIVVPVAAVATVVDLPWESVSPEGVGAVTSRLTLASAMRALAVDRARVVVVLRDGTSFSGTPDRVGGDFLDIAVHQGDSAPRAAAVTMRATVAYEAISKVVREAAAWA
ncbi:MAG: hypothetical protein QOI06_2014 [Nocardioidaceae bacterium]|nr:hypothetical protein [Nocardioidaceae bacterium]